MDFESQVIGSFQTGSRVICDPPVMDTDDDYVILVADPDAFFEWADNNGYTQTSQEGYDHTAASLFTTYRKNEVNLILTNSEEFFEKFRLATEVGKKLNVQTKKGRKVLFQAILYGVLYDPA